MNITNKDFKSLIKQYRKELKQCCIVEHCEIIKKQIDALKEYVKWLNNE